MISEEKRNDYLVQITAALLSSGHYTGLDIDDGDDGDSGIPYPRLARNGLNRAVMDAEEILDELFAEEGE